MNWEAAKTWLILAFLLLDSVLGWQVYERHLAQIDYAEPYSDLLANTKTLLSEHGLSLDVAVPEAHGKMSFITAQYAQPTLASIVHVSFPNAVSPTIDQNAGDAHAANGLIAMVDRGTWKVNYTAPFVQITKDPAEVLSVVWHGDSYSIDKGQVVSTVSVAALPATENGAASSTALGPQAGDNKAIKRYNFTEEYQSYPIFDAGVQADVGQNKLWSFQQTAIVNVTAVGDAKPTISAVDALDSLANAVDKSLSSQDDRIQSIELGYAHKVSGTESPPATPTSSDYWFPVWRIVTTHAMYYVNAYTGEVNTPTTSP